MILMASSFTPAHRIEVKMVPLGTDLEELVKFSQAMEHFRLER